MIHTSTFDETHLAQAFATIGMYDGVHLGHQAILKPMISAAHAAGSPSAVVTFYPHPAVALRGVDDPLYLTTPDERAALLGDLGIDAVLTLNFDSALAATPASDFMTQMRASLGLRCLWVGEDFALGRGRTGDLPTLRALGEDLDYEVNVVPPAGAEGARISSSRIRTALREGQVRTANTLLGRPYTLHGPVIHGDARGRTIGLPTANLDVWPHKLLPCNGVYVTRALVGGQRVGAVTNIGARPTFNGLGIRVEAHLLDFNADLYQLPMALEFIEFLRPEQRFDSIEALLAQIEQDKKRAREVMTHAA